MNLSNEQIKKILDEAPEGATHWCVNISGKNPSEYGFDGCCVYGHVFADGKWNQIPLSDLRKQLDDEWVNGLPPIGVECEVYGALGKYDEWQRCEVFAIKHGDVFIANDKEWVVRSKNDVKFRKIETEAKKAEREMMELVDAAMLAIDAEDLDQSSVKDVVLRMIAAKYRKEVE